MRARRLLFRCLLLGAAGLLVWSSVALVYRQLYPQKYAGWVQQYADEYGVPPELIFAVIRTESGFKPEAVSNMGARGLMQITEETFEWARYRMQDDGTQYGDLFDPQTNIRYGSFILSLLLEEFGSVDNALCAYHAGWGRVKGWLGSEQYSSDGESIHTIPVKETRWYLVKVGKAMAVYRRLYRL